MFIKAVAYLFDKNTEEYVTKSYCEILLQFKNKRFLFLIYFKI